MARSDEDDTLEPILPKHPPIAGETPPAATEAPAIDAPAVRPGWERLVLLGCAVVATLALVVCALRLSSIADDQRVQTCQTRAFAEEQLAGSNTGGQPRRLGESLARCVGLDVPATDEG
jgi:hypothetical protein